MAEYGKGAHHYVVPRRHLSRSGADQSPGVETTGAAVVGSLW
jgi:hypothetical protein